MDWRARFEEIVEVGMVRRLLTIARDEDLGEIGDVTSQALIPADRTGRLVMRAREEGMVAGLAALPMATEIFGGGAKWLARSCDGSRAQPGIVLGEFSGPLRALLALERTALNLVGRLSGIATITQHFVQEVAGTRAVICETRKTTPGLRTLEKYAVVCGGGTLHRRGLFDAILVKDNHIAGIDPSDLAAVLEPALRAARDRWTLRFVEVEVDSLDQLDAVLALPAGLVDIVLLDNMSESVLREAVMRRSAQAPSVLLEASGGVSLATVRGVAETGIDRISVGSLTHGARALDVGLDAA